MTERADVHLNPSEIELLRHSTIGVTGATGFLGRHVLDVLLPYGAKICAVARHPGLLPPGISFQVGDLRNPADCEAFVQGCDFVIHLAALGGGFHANLNRDFVLLTDNLIMSFQLLRAAVGAGVQRYVYVSSSAVYGRRTGKLQEDDAGPPFLTSELGFAMAKWTAEEQLRMASQGGQIHGIIVRPTNPYGPYDTLKVENAHFISSVILRLLQQNIHQLELRGNPAIHRNFVYGGDVGLGIVLALLRGKSGQAYNLGAHENHTLEEVVSSVIELMGLSGFSVRYDTTAPAGHPGRLPDLGRVRQELGYNPEVGLDEGLRRTVEWYRSTVTQIQ